MAKIKQIPYNFSMKSMRFNTFNGKKKRLTPFNPSCCICRANRGDKMTRDRGVKNIAYSFDWHTS